VTWSLEVQGVRSEGYRDTRGPGRAGFLALLGQLDGRPDAKGFRDRALLRLLYDLGLRRAEAVGLDVEDLDRQSGTLAVLGKGRSEKVRLTLPDETRAAVEAWLAVRGDGPGPLFRSIDRAGRLKGRLSGTAVYLIVRQLGQRAGLRARPHGLRHAAITEALDLTGGDVRAVQRFSRHRDVRVLQRYDDNRKDLAGDVARRVAAAAGDASRQAG
jgi:integrase/recombinase XerC